MTDAVCVFCSASDQIAEYHRDTAAELGRILAELGRPLVYGGGRVGLMGILARAVHQHGGTVIGIIPQGLMRREVVYQECDELVITKNLQDRKEIMIERSGSFVALAGGFGTLDEMLEVITQRQLGYHQKPIVFINDRGFYSHQLAFFDHLAAEGFTHGHGREGRQLYDVYPDVQAFGARLATPEQ